MTLPTNHRGQYAVYNIVNSTKIDNRQKNPLLKIDLYTAFSKQLKSACPQVFSSGGTCTLYYYKKMVGQTQRHTKPQFLTELFFFDNSVQEGQSSVYDTKNTECTNLRAENETTQ
jgi:hypothetical protein